MTEPIHQLIATAKRMAKRSSKRRTVARLGALADFIAAADAKKCRPGRTSRRPAIARDPRAPALAAERPKCCAR